MYSSKIISYSLLCSSIQRVMRFVARFRAHYIRCTSNRTANIADAGTVYSLYTERSRQCCVNYYAQQLLRGFFVVCTTTWSAYVHESVLSRRTSPVSPGKMGTICRGVVPAIRRRRHLGLFVSSKSGDGSVTLRQPVSSAVGEAHRLP